ncbi:MAG: hypothetical protein Q9195_000926 [Heterodermia aff. obscurata]
MARRGGGRSKDKGSGNSSEPRDVQISKAMSWLLRHGAKGEGIKMDANGYINVADLMAWRKFHNLSVTLSELRTVVDTNAKQRFSMIPLPSTISGHSDDDPSHYLIRANQGHSLAISSENLLKPILATDSDFPSLVVHGTNDEAWSGIRKSGGLKRMSRRHVHFATGVPEALNKGNVTVNSSSTPAPKTAKNRISDESGDIVIGNQGVEASLPSTSDSTEATKVISGMRANATVLIWVNVARSMNEGGLKWWRSDNGVILTEGDAHGTVSMDWFDKVEMKGTGKSIWTRAEDRK